MVNEAVVSDKQQQQQQHTKSQQDQPQQQQQQEQSSENFSWTFFEEVSSVDNQLRCEHESSIIAVTSNNDHVNDDDDHVTIISNGQCEVEKTPTIVTNNNNNNNNNNDINSTLMTTNGRAITHDLSALNIRVNDQRLHHQHHIVTHPPHTQHQQQQEEHSRPPPHNDTIIGKPNGLVNTAIVHADILSQQSPDLILPPTQPAAAPFQFTSPTSTFKRKKQQQQLQQQQQQHLNSHKRKQLTEETQPQHRRHPSSSAITLGSSLRPEQQQQQQQQQHLYNETTVMISGAGSIINPDTGIGIGSNAKTRTLPAISTQTGRHAVDLVSSATHKPKKKPGKRIQTQTDTSDDPTAKSSAKMGSKLTTGQNGTHSRTPTSSNNNRDDTSLKKPHQRRVSTAQTQSFIDGIEMNLGLIGWRKKCLYTVLLLLMLLIITNLVLTLWILKVMEFSPEGMGQLKIVPGGIQLTGQTIIMDMLRASTIRSRHGQSIAIESSRNFSINTRDANGKLENHLFLGHDKLECLATAFRINDTAGRNLFSVNRNEVTIGAHALRIEGEGGAIFRESIQTPHVRAEPGRELRFESPTRQIEMTAARDINLQSRAGGIELSALEDVKLSALDGSIRLESSKILMPNLRTAQPPLPGAAQSRDHLHRVFQLCACANGKLFLAAPHSICAGDDSTVCR